jgi:hypothetical protein
MRGQMPIALLALVLATLETAGAAQELVYLGILRSETYPLVAGALGTLAGVLLLAAGVALLLGSPLVAVLVPATAWISVPVFILTGIVTHRAGWPITAAGILFPLFMVFFCQKIGKAGNVLSKT